MYSVRLLSLLLLPFLSLVNADDDPPHCAVHHCGTYFDLSGLSRQQDYIIESFGRNFTLNVCQSVRTEVWNLQGGTDSDTALVGGFYRGMHGDVSIGSFNTTPVIHNDQPYIFMLDGSPCSSSNPELRASTAIRFVCDALVLTQGSPEVVAMLPPQGDSCSFFVEWRTHLACPTTKRTGTGGFIAVFSAILFVALLVYIFGAFIYNRFVLGLRGKDQIPALSIIPVSSTLSFFRNGLHSVQDRVDSWRSGGHSSVGDGKKWGSWGAGNQRNGFSRLPREEEEAIIEGRFSVDDDEEDGPVMYNDIHRTGAVPPPATK